MKEVEKILEILQGKSQREVNEVLEDLDRELKAALKVS